jgi:hypothetical protein
LQLVEQAGGKEFPPAHGGRGNDLKGYFLRSTIALKGAYADRRAAEYALSIGGTVKVNDQAQEIKAAADLPAAAFRLTYVSFRGNNQVNDEGLVHFKDCKKLTGLGLSGTQVTDAGLAHFKDCKNLTVFHLAGTQVSDAGLAHFKDRKNLTRTYLDSTQVTDAGLADLAGRDKLTELNLANTKVTAKGVEGLAKALPKCKITWDSGVIEPRP